MDEMCDGSRFVWCHKTREAVLSLHLQIPICLTLSCSQNSMVEIKWWKGGGTYIHTYRDVIDREYSESSICFEFSSTGMVMYFICFLVFFK